MFLPTYDPIEFLKTWSNLVPAGGALFSNVLLRSGVYIGPVPSGKGAFLSVAGAYGSPQELVNLCKSANLTFLSFDAKFSNIKPYAAACHKAGIGVWVWQSFTSTAATDETVANMLAVAKDIGAQGIMPDPEAPFQSEPAAAQHLADVLKAHYNSYFGIGLTTYGAARLQGNFPWAQLGGVGFGIPQVYLWHTARPGSTLQSIQDWKNKGWKHIVPAIPVWSESDKPQTPEQLVSLLDECKQAGCKGVIAWSLIHMKNNPVLWDTYARYAW